MIWPSKILKLKCSPLLSWFVINVILPLNVLSWDSKILLCDSLRSLSLLHQSFQKRLSTTKHPVPLAWIPLVRFQSIFEQRPTNRHWEKMFPRKKCNSYITMWFDFYSQIFMEPNERSFFFRCFSLCTYGILGTTIFGFLISYYFQIMCM